MSESNGAPETEPGPPSANAEICADTLKAEPPSQGLKMPPIILGEDIPKRVNKVSEAKAEPNYLKNTPSLQIRQRTRGIGPRLSAEEVETLKKKLKPTRRSPPVQVTTYKPKKPVRLGICPFRVTPNPIVFERFDVGGVYEILVEVANATANGQRIRIKPLKSDIISFELEFRGPPLTAPGMSVYIKVLFLPRDLNDVQAMLTLQTEDGDYDFPVLAIRDPPQLVVREKVHCGCMLAGGSKKFTRFQVANYGGEAAYRICARDNDDDFHYLEEDGATTLVMPPFRISPVSFYLKRDEKCEVAVEFIATDQDIGAVSRHIQMECDSREVTPVELFAVVDGLRCELVQWLGTPVPPVPANLWMSKQPWRLFWHTQVRQRHIEKVVIGNGSHLPLDVRWMIIQPPTAVLRQLSTGTLPFLTANILENMVNWQQTDDGFSVHPHVCTIAPFSNHTFDFMFQAAAPIGRLVTKFAVLCGMNLPTKELFETGGGQSLKRALVPFADALGLQKSFNHAEAKSTSGFPLAANRLFDFRAPGAVHQEPACAFSAFCLQGTTLAPQIRVQPPIAAFPGAVLPYVPNVFQVSITNTSRFPVTFRVRTLKTDNWEYCDMFKPIMVVSEEDVGCGPETHYLHPPFVDLDDEETRSKWAKYYGISEPMWPPLPPDVTDGTHPGEGALATVVVRPHTGTLRVGETVAVELILRCACAADIDALLQFELDDSAPPMQLRLLASVRAPTIEMRDTPVLDFGIVRAHQVHSASFTLSNPSHMPCLVFVEHALDTRKQPRTAGIGSHKKICARYIQECDDAARSIMSPGNQPEIHDLDPDTDSVVGGELIRATQEAKVRPWICARCGCRDTSGRPGPDQGHIVDQIFEMEEWYIVPPMSSTKVKVHFRARHVECFRTFLDIRLFDSGEVLSLGVLAFVQLPVVTISQGHLTYPVSYLKRASEVLSFEMHNASDMEAIFEWKYQDKTETPLEVQVCPQRGCIPPRGSLTITSVVVPVSSNDAAVGRAEVRLYVESRILSIPLLITAYIYSIEVDGAIVAPDELEPTIAYIPRMLDANRDQAGVFHFESTSKIPMLDFGSMEVQTSKKMKLVMYNRSAIDTPFTVTMQKYPEYNPLRKASTVAQTVMAMARMQHGANNNESDETSEVETMQHENAPKARAVQDMQEPRGFRSKNGIEYFEKKAIDAKGSTALKYGYGWAVKLFPNVGWIPANGSVSVECTAYSDLPGEMKDLICVNIREMPKFFVPVRLVSTGTALYLPPLQVSLTLGPPPHLDMGSMVLAEKEVRRTFKLANASESEVVVKWSVYPTANIENCERALIQFSHIGGVFTASSLEPHSTTQCAVEVSPPRGVLPKRGTTMFTVTLKPRRGAGTYQYKLIGVASLRDPRRRNYEVDHPKDSSMPSLEVSTTTALTSQVESEEARVVRQLSAISCADSDDDREDDPVQVEEVEWFDPEPVEQEPLCTMVLDVSGTCVTPKLMIDKKLDSDGIPIVKYFHTSVPEADLHRTVDPRFPTHMAPGAIVVGGGVQDPVRGIASALLRGIMFTNVHRCPVHTQLRIDRGPFRIVRVEQVGKWPQRQDGVFVACLEWKHTIDVWIEFVPPAWDKWEGHEQSFVGELLIEYPHADDTISKEETQRVKLAGICRKPKLWINVVEIIGPIVPRPINEDVLVVEFFRVHVHAQVEVKRRLVMRNETNVCAQWKVFHVARKLGRRASETDSLDNPECFVFAQSEGKLYGPSIEYRVIPLGPALERYLPHEDTHEYQPHYLHVAFHPNKDEEYMSRFRFQVEGGSSVDVICHGHGSYNEEDDVMELEEA